MLHEIYEEKAMRIQPYYDNLLTKDFFEKYYVQQKMPYSSLREMLKKQGYNICLSTLCKYANRHGLGRSVTEARIQVIHEHPLDWSKTILNDSILEAIDGFLLGDGSAGTNRLETAGRLTCGVEHQEFCSYMMSFFSSYQSIWAKYNNASMKQGFVWNGMTSFHPDICQQYLRWYPFVKEKGKRDKQPPDDVRITPTSVMLWYLGDGSLIVDKEANTIMLRISTDSFLPERVEFLASKLKDKGIACHRNNDNRIMVEARGIPSFFDFIGHQSPVKCYDYKFELPQWRLDSKRMRDVAEELKVDYQRLAYLVKIGKIPCLRASDKGKPRFLPEHVEACRSLLASGELY